MIEAESNQRGPGSTFGWTELQTSIAHASGLAVVLVENDDIAHPVVDSNNNSICQSFQSTSLSHLCEPYCGTATDRSIGAAGLAFYQCHAGLSCVAMSAMSLDISSERHLALIGGRAFVSIEPYLNFTRRVMKGELPELPEAELFRNVLFADEERLNALAQKLRSSIAEVKKNNSARSLPVKSPDKKFSQIVELQANGFHSDNFVASDSLREFSQTILEKLCASEHLNSAAILLRDGNVYNSLHQVGSLVSTLPPRVAIDVQESVLLGAAKSGFSISRIPIRFLEAHQASDNSSLHQLHTECFPLMTGNQVVGALLVADQLADSQRERISNYCQQISMPFVFTKLREELNQFGAFFSSLHNMIEQSEAHQPVDIYANILRYSSQLLQAERSSLQLFDEKSEELTVSAAFGYHAEEATASRTRLGSGVSGAVLERGQPLLVGREKHAEFTALSPGRKYKTDSFISYPITIGTRKIGVLNVTDKYEGRAYDETDLQLLQMIGPQVALALDRVRWREQAMYFQTASVTDPLTGVFNRRYLEARLEEEFERTKRHGGELCFLMIDVDDFKTYNSLHGHQAGDEVLQIASRCLKACLRVTDVAARYGGDEFCLLLPQTGMFEARVIAERIRHGIELTEFQYAQEQPLGSITVSIGIGSVAPEMNKPRDMIFAADRALYIAKSRGKNRVYSSGTSLISIDERFADET